MSSDTAEAGGEAQRKAPAAGGSSNRIQVSNTKKPLFCYVNLAKRYMHQHSEVELSALGMEIRTSTVEIKDEMRGRPIQKAKIEIVLGKSDKFDEMIATATEEATVGDGEEET